MSLGFQWMYGKEVEVEVDGAPPHCSFFLTERGVIMQHIPGTLVNVSPSEHSPGCTQLVNGDPQYFFSSLGHF